LKKKSKNSPEMKIDHSKHNLVDAFGMNPTYYTELIKAVKKEVQVAVKKKGPMSDSELYENIFKELKSSNFGLVSPEDKELMVFLSGILVSLSFTGFKKQHIEQDKDGKNNPLTELMNVLSKLTKDGATPGKMVFAGDVPPAIKDLVEKLGGKGPMEVEIHDGKTKEEIESEILDSEDLFQETEKKSPKKSKKEPKADFDLAEMLGELDTDAMEAKMLDNLDEVKDDDLAFFVDVIKKCDETCDIGKKLTCKIYKRYEELGD
jgi:hypothetical protein